MKKHDKYAQLHVFAFLFAFFSFFAYYCALFLRCYLLFFCFVFAVCFFFALFVHFHVLLCCLFFTFFTKKENYLMVGHVWLPSPNTRVFNSSAGVKIPHRVSATLHKLYITRLVLFLQRSAACI